MRAYAPKEEQAILLLSAGLKGASIMLEDQYVVALQVQPCNSVPYEVLLPTALLFDGICAFGFVRAQGEKKDYSLDTQTAIIWKKNNTKVVSLCW